MCESGLDGLAPRAILPRIRMPKRSSALLLLGWLGCMPGCSSGASANTGETALEHGGQTGGEAGIQCTAATAIEPLALDAASPLGFSASDVLSACDSATPALLHWANGGSTALQLTLSASGNAGYAASCHANAVNVSLSVRSADGAFAEVIAGRLFAKERDRATLSVELSAQAVHGSYFASGSGSLATENLKFDVEFVGSSYTGEIETVNADDTTLVGSF